MSKTMARAIRSLVRGLVRGCLRRSVGRAASRAGLLAAAVLGAGCDRDPGQGLLEGLHTVPIVDAQGFAQPMTAATLEVPDDWIAEGGVVWERSSCVLNGLRTEWQARSPDGRSAIEVLPGLDWQVRGMTVPVHPCPTTSMHTVRDYLVVLVHQRRPGARIVAYRARPDLLAAQPVSPDPPGMAPRRVWRDAGEVMLSYGIDGTPMRETIAAIASFSEMNTAGRPFRVGYVSHSIAVRGPDGAFGADFADRVRASWKTDPQWTAAATEKVRQAVDTFGAQQRRDIQSWHEREMARISARGAADRAQIRADAVREVGRIHAEGWARRQESQDRLHRETIDTIREVNRYHDPVDGRQVELSSHQDHGWRLDDGSHLSTDDPNFDPYRSLGVGGQEMQRVR